MALGSDISAAITWQLDRLGNAADATRAVQALRQLARDAAATPGFVSRFVDCGGVASLIASLVRFSASAEAQELGSRLLLSCIVCSASCRDLVVAAGAAEAVVSMMRAHSASIAVQEVGCKVLKELAARSVAGQDAIVRSGGLDAVVAAMGSFEEEVGIQVAGCGVFRNFSAESAKHMRALETLGAIGLVLGAMTRHSEDAPVQWAGCWALCCLSSKSKALLADARAQGAVRAVLQAMGRHARATKVLEAAFWALSLVAAGAGPSLELYECVQAVTRSMREHPQEAELLRTGGALRRKLIASGEARRGSQSVIHGSGGTSKKHEQQHLVRTTISKRRGTARSCGLDTIREERSPRHRRAGAVR